VRSRAEVADVAYQGVPARAARASVGPIARRALDFALALTLLLTIFPLLLLIALAIKCDSRGPIIFRQPRLGHRRRTISVWKFRTMRADASSDRHREYVTSLIGGGAAAQTHADGRFLYKLAVDDRISRVGRLLRSTSLDELPQLWNVLRGDMSLVGPRPVIAYEADCYPTAWNARFDVKPGMTGLWQVNGRNQRTYAEMIECDLQYVARRSLRLDLGILARTVLVVLLRRGAA
jgi:lipopolysaccharide/colanic/teichoic acid biosynthesis glycosyltransferase